jgi:hypothetical protein
MISVDSRKFMDTVKKLTDINQDFRKLYGIDYNAIKLKEIKY